MKKKLKHEAFFRAVNNHFERKAIARNQQLLGRSMSAKNTGQSQLMFVTIANADLLYMKPHARKPSFPGPVTPSATE